MQRKSRLVTFAVVLILISVAFEVNGTVFVKTTTVTANCTGTALISDINQSQTFTAPCTGTLTYTSTAPNSTTTSTSTVSSTTSGGLSQPLMIHAFSYNSTTGVCGALSIPLMTSLILSNFTATDQKNRTGTFAIHNVASDINHGYFSDAQIIQNSTGHFFMFTLWKNGNLIRNSTYPFHKGEVPLPNRPFQYLDTLAVYLGPFSIVSAFWYGLDNGTQRIVGGANGGILPPDFNATDITTFWGAINSQGFVTFHSLPTDRTPFNVFMQVGQSPGAPNPVPVIYTLGGSQPLPCAVNILPITSNLCEQEMALDYDGGKFVTSIEVCMDILGA